MTASPVTKRLIESCDQRLKRRQHGWISKVSVGAQVACAQTMYEHSKSRLAGFYMYMVYRHRQASAKYLFAPAASMPHPPNNHSLP